MYIYDDERLLAEYAGGSLSREYVYGAGALLATHDSGTLYYHARDNRSIRVNMDTSGNVAGEQAHYPFGEDWYMSGTTSTRHFNTYRRDAESGNDYAVHRFDVNRLGRFSSVDPVLGTSRDPQSFNRYTCAHANPINLSDRTGQYYSPPPPPEGCPDPTAPFCGNAPPCPDSAAEWACGSGGGGGGGTPVCNEGGCSGGGGGELPPPPPPTPNCFCELRYRGVDETFGLATHTFWREEVQSGTFYVIDGGPSGFGFPLGFGYLTDWVTPGNTGHYPEDNLAAPVSYSTGASSGACYNAEQLLAAAYAWPSRTWAYLPTGPNSNTFANWVGNDAGMYPSEPPGAIGWWWPFTPQRNLGWGRTAHDD